VTGRNVLFEFHRMGNYVKVTAVDTETLVEVSIQGPAWASELVLRQNAVRRLEYVLRKQGLLAP